ncbi:MAG: pyridoxamine 5-phosphate oxidase-related FMN-binding protein [Frankiales bacterium]|nr:pyridoxamine 5-phosphate oxidase-related FMN-binding protein [Frankiales bacterium]
MPPTPPGLALGRRLAGSALDNARASLTSIADAVSDRRQLQGQPHEVGNLERLTTGACLELLATRTTGRLAYVARAGSPDIVPVNYVLRDGAVLIRSGPGPKLQAAERRERVAFEVDDIDEVTHSGWSVVVTGRAERLSFVQADALDLPTPWVKGPRRHTLRIALQHVEGRRLL